MARTILLAVFSGAVALDVRDAHKCMDEMGDQGYWPGCCYASDRSCWQGQCGVPEGNWTGCEGTGDDACVVDTVSCTLACYCASNHWMEPLRMNEGGYPETADHFNQVSLKDCEHNRFDNIDGRLTCTNNTEHTCDIGFTQPKEGTIVIEPNDGTKCGETCCGECVTWDYHCWNCAPFAEMPRCMNLVDYTTVTTTTTPPTWTQRSLVADEGNELKSLDSVTADDCKAACEADAACHSFSFSSEKAHCHLKDKCVHADDPNDHNPNHRGYITHYKPCTSLIIV